MHMIVDIYIDFVSSLREALVTRKLQGQLLQFQCGFQYVNVIFLPFYTLYNRNGHYGNRPHFNTHACTITISCT